MRKIFIGDIHGMLEELQHLVSEIRPTSDDTLMFVGDLMDKGPDSAQTVKWVRELASTHNVVLVKGNHEWKHERFRKKFCSGDISGAMATKNSEEIREITEGLDTEDIAFLDAAPGFFRVGDYLVVHGGIPGNMSSLPASPSMAGISSKERGPFEMMMMTRFINQSSGKMLSLGTQTEGDPYWAAVYDGRFGRVVFGHEPFLGSPGRFPHAVGIDTGAVYGGGLTAMVVDAEGNESFVTVPSRTFHDRSGDLPE